MSTKTKLKPAARVRYTAGLGRFGVIDWKKVKPEKPGEYLTRWEKDGSCVSAVTVTKTKRGLSVFCAAYNDRVAMSKIGDTELEWAERPNGKHSNTPKQNT